MKRILLIGGLSILLFGAVGAGVAAFAGSGGADQGGADQGETKKGSAEQGTAEQGTKQEDAGGIHGGPIDRFHEGGSCDLVGIGGLAGNWTHGDYVSAVDALGDVTLIVEAAHSDCGKPMKSVGHGGGPPEHALEHAVKGLEKANDAQEAAAEKADEAKEIAGAS